MPSFDAFYGNAVRALEYLADGEVGRCARPRRRHGSDEAPRVAQAFPAARFELLDGSAEMLAEARERLGDLVTAVHVQDMGADLPDGPFDAVISALAIHHLGDDHKRLLFR